MKWTNWCQLTLTLMIFCPFECGNYSPLFEASPSAFNDLKRWDLQWQLGFLVLHFSLPNHRLKSPRNINQGSVCLVQMWNKWKCEFPFVLGCQQEPSEMKSLLFIWVILLALKHICVTPWFLTLLSHAWKKQGFLTKSIFLLHCANARPQALAANSELWS